MPSPAIFSLAVIALSAGAGSPQTTGAPSGAAECAERSVQRQLERAAAILGDWPNLGRYRDANALLPAPAKSEARVVFMGDSITDNCCCPSTTATAIGRASR